MQCEMVFLRVVSFNIYFLIRFSSDHTEISMASANIDALYACSLKIQVSYFFSE